MLDIGDPTEFVFRAVMSLVVFILSLTVHEYAHARVAFFLGDDTASRHGRLTLNPIPHIDIIGTIILPILGSAGVPVIGWAKPVPVNPVRLTRRFSMRAGHAVVAAAGPLSNFLLAFLCVAILALLQHLDLGTGSAVEPLLSYMLIANIGLAFFNLLPVPPLDGSRLMPRSLDGVMDFMRRYSMIVFIVIIIFGRRFLAVPVGLLTVFLAQLFGVQLRFF